MGWHVPLRDSRYVIVVLPYLCWFYWKFTKDVFDNLIPSFRIRIEIRANIYLNSPEIL